VISETTRLVHFVLSNDLNFEKSEQLESNVLEHHPVETKASDGQ